MIGIVEEAHEARKDGGKMLAQQNYLMSAAHYVVYNLLVDVARRKAAPIGYNKIFQIMKLKPGNYAAGEAGRLLGDVSKHACHSGRPMLSALVVNQEDKMPGKGFFNLAVELGKLPIGASDQEKKAFWKAELARVYASEW